jgi:hypothetical protein
MAKGCSYNFSTYPEILERAWTNAVATYRPDDEILWSVGLRGLSDQSYADLDTSMRNNDPFNYPQAAHQVRSPTGYR